VVEDGGDPINVMRTAPADGYIKLAIEHCRYPDGFDGGNQDTRVGQIDVVENLKPVPA